MTNNEKLACWQGWPKTVETFYPNYLNDDSAAMSLLDTLVEKDINYSMTGWKNDGVPVHTIEVDHVDLALIHAHATTRREAVVAAVLELIEKEASHDV